MISSSLGVYLLLHSVPETAVENKFLMLSVKTGSKFNCFSSIIHLWMYGNSATIIISPRNPKTCHKLCLSSHKRLWVINRKFRDTTTNGFYLVVASQNVNLIVGNCKYFWGKWNLSRWLKTHFWHQKCITEKICFTGCYSKENVSKWLPQKNLTLFNSKKSPVIRSPLFP